MPVAIVHPSARIWCLGFHIRNPCPPLPAVNNLNENVNPSEAEHTIYLLSLPIAPSFEQIFYICGNELSGAGQEGNSKPGHNPNGVDEDSCNRHWVLSDTSVEAPETLPDCVIKAEGELAGLTINKGSLDLREEEALAISAVNDAI